MYMAEAAQTGDIAMATDVINERRAAAGLPTMTAPATQSEMIELVIEERRRELFVEGAHRFNDMIRFRGTQFEVPFLVSPARSIRTESARRGTCTARPRACRCRSSRRTATPTSRDERGEAGRLRGRGGRPGW